MNRYKVLYEIGDGTYGTVYLAEKVSSGEQVAVKRLKRKFFTWNEAMNLKEVQSLKQLRHRNIVKLKEVIREHNILYFIFEKMDSNLLELMHSRKSQLSDFEISFIVYQILQGLAYVHANNYFHRDLKPENILCLNGINSVKIADLGLAKETVSELPFTEYVSTRWYRAPEVLLCSPIYGPSIDIWALACILCELYLLKPIFPGVSQTDQLYRICSILGTPKDEQWSPFLPLTKAMNINLVFFEKQPLKLIIKNASYSAVSLLEKMFTWNPKSRLTAKQALKNAYFNSAKSRYFEIYDDHKKEQNIEPLFLKARSKPKTFTKTIIDLDSILNDDETYASSPLNQQVEELVIPLNHRKQKQDETKKQFLSISRVVDSDAYNLGIELIERASKKSAVLEEDKYETIWKITW